MRTEQESDRRRREVVDLLVLPRPAKSLQNGAGFSGKLEQTGSAKNERMASVPQRKQLASMPEPLLPKEKEHSCLSKVPDCKVGESQGEREPYLGKRGEDYSTNQQPSQRGGAVPDLIWIGSKWLLAFPRVPLTLGIPLAQNNSLVY